jgi:competence ComEA-like helix-hairpin-helix protein
MRVKRGIDVSNAAVGCCGNRRRGPTVPIAGFGVEAGMAELRDEGMPMDRFVMDEPIDLNSASRDRLRAIPDIGEGRAGAILAWRERHGRFETVDDLQHVPEIGPAALPALRRHFKV